MPWITVMDTETGAKHNNLADSVDIAKRLTASKLSESKGPYWRGRVVEGARYVVDGESFDVEFYREEPSAPPPREIKRDYAGQAPRYRNAEAAWEAEDEQAWYRLRHGR